MMVWKPIDTGPPNQIIGAWRDGSRWSCAHLFFELPQEEWVNIRSDRIERPEFWAPLPDTPCPSAHDPA